MLKKILVGLIGVLVIVVAGAGAGLVWAGGKAEERLAVKYSPKVTDVPVPWPLSDEEVAALRAEKQAELAKNASEGEGEGESDEGAAAGEAEAPAAEAADPLAGVDLAARARERAIERGKHIVESRASCTHCHGEDWAGGVIVENGAMGRWAAPNITGGEGSANRDYQTIDYVRTLRHGVKRDGTPVTMPSMDFSGLSDQELSDIITFMQSLPRVDKVMPPSDFGPIFKMLLATGEFPISAESIDHEAARPVTPPAANADAAFGGHLAVTCQGCHGPGLSGGKIPGADPAWPAAANLTPHETGLEGWELADFKTALREGRNKDGKELNQVAMPVPFLKNMKDVEIEALFAYLKTVPPKAKGGR